MTLQLVKSPPAVSLVGNEILFKVNTDNQYSNYGSYAELIIRWTTGDSNGNSFTLAWGNHEIEFTCATTPDDSGLQYPVYTSGSVDNWVESLVPYFKANYLLSKDFTVVWQASGSIIRIKSFNKGSQYSFTLTPGTSNIIIYNNTAGIDPVTREFYSLNCRVWIPGTGIADYILLGEISLTPDADGNVLFKIQEYLNSQLSFGFEWPEEPTTFLFKKANAIAKYFIEYAEKFDNEGKKLFSTEGTETYTVLGGIDRIALAKLNEENKSWWDKFLFKKDFLTNQPRQLYISKTQPIKLSFLVWKSGITSIKLKTHITYLDGLSSTLVKSISASQYEAFECILSLLKLGIDADEVDNYEVWLTDQDDNRISISRYFYIDHVYRENERTFLFQNSLGSVEALRFSGVSETKVNLDRSSIAIINEESFTWRNFEIRNNFNIETQKFKFNSGWLNNLAVYPKQFADYLREFYLSRGIYELINNRLYPILITSKKQFIDESDESLTYVEFEAERAYTDKYFGQDENIHPSTGFESKFNQDEYLNQK